MAGVNKVILVGNLGKDPEVRYTQGGQAVANFSLACSESWTDKSGEKQERTEWVRVVVWGKLAELCGEYLTKGRTAYVEGRLQTREWTNKEGAKQYTTEVNASEVVFLGGGKGAGGSDEADFGPPPSSGRASSPGGGAVFPGYGRAKGQPVAGASADTLAYYAEGARKSLADPSKSKWHDKERALLAAIEAEQARQSGGGSRGGPSDEDIPF